MIYFFIFALMVVLLFTFDQTGHCLCVILFQVATQGDGRFFSTKLGLI